MNYQQILDEIKRKQENEFSGILFPHSRVHDYIPTIEKATYYLVGGETGTGKTAFADDTFLYYVLEQHKKVHFIYFSFEISTESKIVKGIARNLFKQYGVLTDVNYILSRGKNRIDDTIYGYCVEQADYFNELFDKLTIFDIPNNPTGMYKDIVKVMEKFGTVKREKIAIGEGKETTKTSFTWNDPDQYVICFFDHFALTNPEKGLTTKMTIDTLSKYIVFLRNHFGITAVGIQQFSREIEATDRVQIERIRPQLSDFKDSGNTQQDANVVMGLFHPGKFGLDKIGKYEKLTQVADRIRWLYILKNREGASNFHYGLSFLGECGFFKELPSPDKFTDEYIARLNTPKHYRKLLQENGNSNNN